MKKYLFFIFIIVSCKKEMHVPEILVGTWEMKTTYFEGYYNNFRDTIYRYDTISQTNTYSYTFSRNFIVTTSRLYPNCQGTFSLIRNDKFLKLYFPCSEIPNISTGSFLLKILELKKDTLTIEDSF